MRFLSYFRTIFIEEVVKWRHGLSIAVCVSSSKTFRIGYLLLNGFCFIFWLRTFIVIHFPQMYSTIGFMWFFYLSRLLLLPFSSFLVLFNRLRFWYVRSICFQCFVLFYLVLSDVRSTDSVSLLSLVANLAVGVSGVLRYSKPFTVQEYIYWHVSGFHTRKFALMPVGETQTVNAG